MRGAFVVQLTRPRQDRADQMEGSIEEVDTGRQLRFHSGDELIAFLREQFTRDERTLPSGEGEK